MQYQYLLGFILPPFIDLINQHIIDAKMRFWISIAICLIIATLFNLNKLTDWKNILLLAGAIITEAQIIHKQFWGDSQTRAKIFPGTVN